MAEIFAPFEVNGNYPLDKRHVFKTLKDMKSFDTAHLPDTYFAVCVETGSLYVYNKSNNIDSTFGKWRFVCEETEIAIGKDSDGNLIPVSDRIKNEAKDAIYDNDITIADKLDDLTNSKSEIEVNPEDPATNVAQKLKIDGETYTIEGIAETYTNTNPTTSDLGGISKGTTFEGKTMKEMLDMLLYPYVDFTISTVSTSDSAGTFEYGTAKTISKVTTNAVLGSKNISRILIKNGSDTIYNSDTFVNNTAVTLDNSISLNGTTNCTITVALSDGTNTHSKAATFTFNKYVYYTTSQSNTEIPTTGTKYSGAANGDLINTNDNDYIWFFSPNTASGKIQQYVNGAWYTVDGSNYVGTVEFTINSGKTITYYAYVTAQMVASSGYYKLN